MAGKETDLNIDSFLLKKAVVMLRALNHERRQEMLRLLHREGPLPVTALHHRMGLEQSLASQHLAILRQAGLVVTQREGNQVFYSVNYKRLHEVQAQATALLK